MARRALTGAATMLEVPGYRAVDAEYVDGRNPRFREATLFVFPLLVIAGSAGIAVRIRDRRTWPAIAVVGGFVVLSLVTVSVPRLRGPFDLLMCIGIGYLAASSGRGHPRDRHLALAHLIPGRTRPDSHRGTT